MEIDTVAIHSFLLLLGEAGVVFPIIGLVVLSLFVIMLHYRHVSKREVYSNKSLKRAAVFSCLLTALATYGLFRNTYSDIFNLNMQIDYIVFIMFVLVIFIATFLALMPVFNFFSKDKIATTRSMYNKRLDSIRR